MFSENRLTYEEEIMILTCKPKQRKQNSIKYRILPLVNADRPMKNDFVNCPVMSIYNNLKNLEKSNKDEADEISVEKLVEIDLLILKKNRLIN